MHIDVLYQLLNQLFETGTVIGVDESNAQYKVQIGDDESANTQYLNALALRAGTNKSGDLYDAGEQVLIACPSGDLRQGIIIGALPSDTNPSPTTSKDVKTYAFEDGTVISYDKASHHLTADVKGSVDMLCKDDINVVTQQSATIQAIDTATVTAQTVNINGVEGDINIDGVSFLQHTHPQNNGNDLGGGVNTSPPSRVI